MIQLAHIAQREEQRQAQSLGEVAVEARAFCGGVASRAHHGSWLNTSVGMGFNGEVDGRGIDELVAWFVERGVEPRVELCPFADESLTRGLAERGFVPRVFENVFFRDLSAGEGVVAPNELGRSIEIRRVEAGDEAEVRAYSRAVIAGFLPAGAEISEESLDTSARVLRHARTVAFAAWADGQIVGGGAMEIAGEVCALFGMSTVHTHRRMGVQGAVIAARLNHAVACGVKFATIGSKPGIATERTARRFGFELGYTKVHVVRPGVGADGKRLAAVTE